MLVGIYKSFSEDNTMRLAAAATLTRALPITLLNLILTLSSSQSCSIPLHSNAKFLLPTKESRLFSKKIVEFANLNRGETVGQTYNPDQIQQFNMVSKDQKHYFFIEIFFANHNFGAIVSPFSFPSFFNFYVPLPPCPSLPASHITLHFDTHIIAIIRPFKYRE